MADSVTMTPKMLNEGEITEGLFSKARENAVILTKDIDVYADQIHATIEKLFDLHSASQKNIDELMTHFKLLNESFESQLSIYPHFSEDVVSRRIAQSDAAYYTLQAQSAENRKSRMKLMKNTKDRMDESKERQSLAVDASALIKHYKSLLIVSK
ncbi:hypothetical protein SERLADRAFT_410626 [Serpula lacrymans var. lacrymans S7.9]|uniref:Uncharacterized protein n=1 Tax=Serpula lacrymans var. lacrymans (strain S7.9) TaxID=578457 RepID=F8P6R4_SERL9|nr:uncharacterized protein SERLADRAFT_410626 [Serpula lacrymans var. lacrymans S7.9]EGO21130.1 hypothetical protein SERLADRAFT_410626 [Serpula lacrymans var. lacrymans S7.9]